METANAQEISAEGRSRRYLELSDLYRREDRLLAQVCREGQGDIFVARMRK